MKAWLTAPRMRVVALTAITTFFVGLLLKKYIPDNIFGEPAKPLIPKTLAEKTDDPA